MDKTTNDYISIYKEQLKKGDIPICKDLYTRLF